MTKQLYVLAAMALLATCLMGLVGAWHAKSYSVGEPATAAWTPAPPSTMAVYLAPDLRRKPVR
jgi:hypothetical protein